MAKFSIGDRELTLLRYVDKCGEATVREAEVGFGQPRGLARSTVLTMMERLRAKGFLRRRRIKGIYRYSASTAPRDAMRHAVDRFIEKTLGGSVSPFVAWMAERGQLSDQELEDLKALVSRLDADREGT